MEQAAATSGWKTILGLFFCTLKIGAFTFGGGYAMIPIMQREFVTKRGWVSETDILDIFAIAQSVPGVIALNTSVFIGYRVAKTRGAIAAALGVSLPSLLVLSVVSLFYEQFKENSMVIAALRGIRPCVVALILQAVLKLGKPALRDLFCWLIAAAAFGLVAFGGVNPIFVILGAGLTGFLIMTVRDARARRRAGGSPDEKAPEGREGP